MNERITTYLNEVYGRGSETARNLAQQVGAFEQMYVTKVGIILISEDSAYIHNGRDSQLDLNYERVMFDSMVLFCENYVAFIPIHPERTRRSSFWAYSSIRNVSFNDVDGYMVIDDYCLEKVKGHPHWAMDAIRRNVLPRFKE